jgi:HAD superfamily hydrolase (TIGR01450 family)
MQEITCAELLGRYDAVLLDAYGVLVNQRGALPGAAEFLKSLTAAKQPWFVLTNDASRLPETISKRFRGFGLDIAVDQIITSGSLLSAWFAQKKLQGARCMTLGTPDAQAYVKLAGGIVVPPENDVDADVLAVCDDSGYEFLSGVEAAMTMVMRRLDAGKTIHMVVPNPDIIYPKCADAYGYTAGGAALLLEAAWRVRYAADPTPTFTRLGKPHRPIFEAARERSGSRELVLLGDQLGTDILGAKDYGIDSVLLGTGLTHWRPGAVLDPEPTYYLPKLSGF